MYRNVKYLLPAENVSMDGVLVKQALPTNKIAQVDPFLLLHHAKFKFTELAPAIHQGLGPHPHRGFTPVTFVIDGEVHHRDSRGNNQIAKKGEVQWMHAGAGIIHSERPSQSLVEKNGTQEIIQLWINTPAAQKMQIPKYQYIQAKDMPVLQSDDGHIKNKLVCGNYDDQQGPIIAESAITIIWGASIIGGLQVFEISKEYNAVIYVIRGKMKISGFGLVEQKNLVVFDNSYENIEFTLDPETEFLLLTGKPLNEKVVQQGPFVMNSHTQILEAMRDYQMGKMGILIEER